MFLMITPFSLLVTKPVDVFGAPQNPREVESRVLPLNPNPVDQPPLQVILMNRRFRNDSPTHGDSSVMNAIAIARYQRMPIRQWPALVQQSVGARVGHKSNVIEIVGVERHAGWHSNASVLVVTTSTRLIIEKIARYIGETYLSVSSSSNLTRQQRAHRSHSDSLLCVHLVQRLCLPERHNASMGGICKCSPALQGAR